MAYSMGASAGAQGGPDVSRFLEPGEQIVWQGQPARGAGNPLRLGGLIVLGIGVLMGLIFETVGFVLNSGAGDVNRQTLNSVGSAFQIGGAIMFGTMVLVGVILLFVSSFISGNIAYVLTERRAIIAQGPSYGTTRTSLIDLADVGIIKVLERKDGLGSIIFGRSNSYTSSGGSYNTSTYSDRDYSFSNIAEVMNVYHLIRQAQDGAQKAQG